MGKWTDDQLQYLREHSRSQPAAAIAAALGRTEGSVRQKRRSLGLQSYHAGWTKAEEQFLQDQWGVMSIPAIAKRLNRSVEAVVVRKNRLGLGPVLFGGDYISRRCCATVRLCGRRSPHRKAATLTIRFSKRPIRAASLRCAARPRHTRWHQSLSAMCSATNATDGQRAPAMRAIRGIWQWPGRPRSIMRRPSKYQLRRSKMPALSGYES